MNFPKIFMLVFVTLLVAILLGNAWGSYQLPIATTALADQTVMHRTDEPTANIATSATRNYLPIIFLNSATAGGAWLLAGNSGTNWTSDFLGTTDNMTLTLRVNNTTAYRIVPSGTNTPNLIGGSGSNILTAGKTGTTIAGGGDAFAQNRVLEDYAAIGGGRGNTASGYSSFVGGGGSNTASGDNSAIGGGAGNTANNTYAIVGGGASNTAGSAYATVGGGNSNTASGGSSTVGGGNANKAGGSSATVGGGYQNTTNDQNATIGGGLGNVVNGDSAIIGGGYGNTANGSRSVVSGGYLNVASGDYSTVPGGRYGAASHYGEMAYASGQFALAGDAQTSLYVLRNTTTGITVTELFLDGTSSRLTIPSDRVLTFEILIVGTNVNNANSAGYRITGVIKNIGGTTNFVGTPTVDAWENAPAWDATVFDDNTNDALVIQVTGTASATIRWVATVRTAEVAY